jgi:hypothetical protein
MSRGSDVSSSAATVGNDVRPVASRHALPTATLRYPLFIAIPAIWAIDAFLSYPAPIAAYWLIWLYVAFVIGLFVLFLGALFRRRWKEVAVFCAMGPFVLLPYLGPSISLGWLYVEGFRFHASPIDQYLSRCKLIEFVEKEAKQKVGVCERQRLIGEGTLTVIYDTTGELMLPVAQRTPEWTKAMVRFSPGKFFTQSEGRAEHLFGDLYDIVVPLEVADGAPDEY